MNKTYYQSFAAKSLSELEFEARTNYLVRESLKIINEEIDYFFHGRDSMIDTVLDLHSLDKMDIGALRDKLNKIYTKAEVSLLVQKIEKRIRKELRMAQWEFNFTFNLDRISWVEPGCIVPLLREEMKTMLYSTTMSKAVDLAWVKLRGQFVPAAFNKLAAKAKIGDIVLSAVKASPKDVKADLKLKLNKRIKGSFRHYRNQLRRELSLQVYNQLFVTLPSKDAAEMVQAHTA